MQAELVATQWFIEHDHMKQQVIPAELLGQFSDIPNQTFSQQNTKWFIYSVTHS